MKHRVVIENHRPWLRWGITALVMVAVVIVGWLLVSYTRSTTVDDFEATRAQRESLLDERANLRAELRARDREIARLKEQVVFLEHSRDIDRESHAAVRDSLGDLQQKVSRLQEQVAFYRGIVSPEESQAGVRIDHFLISPTDVERVFRYELVLIQSVRHDKEVEGRIELTVHGVADGEMTVLPLSDIVLGDAASLVFSFKYFEEFSGEMRLPAGFQPVRVRVTLDPDGRRQPSIESDYPWTHILGGE